jgi:uncharacterized membrane protein
VKQGLWRPAIRILAALSVGAWALAALFPEAGVSRDVLTAALMLRLSAVAKLACLVLAALFAVLNARRLERDNPARVPWILLALGFAGFAAGQGVLTFHQLVWATSPFPSPADIFFLAGYPLLIAGFAMMARTYHLAYPVRSTAELALIAGAAALVFAALGYRLLSPILAAPANALERFINAAYPALDLMMLIPILVLLRISWGFRGGYVLRPWATLLTGAGVMSVGDICYAYSSVMGWQGLEPFFQIGFLLGYFLLAEGIQGQYRLLTE